MVSASSGLSILGRPAAVEGDTIECRACKSTGSIVCSGLRHHETFRGRNCALEGDLCACRCARPPELLPGQQASFQTLDDADARMPPGAPGQAPLHGSDALVASDPVQDASWIGFRLSEPATCEGLACRLLFDDGSQAHATCMADNRMRLHRVEARSALQVEYRLDDAGTAASLVALLLERIST